LRIALADAQEIAVSPRRPKPAKRGAPRNSSLGLDLFSRLALARHIAELRGGSISVAGRGAELSVRLPIRG